ncbi:hypothetical protein [Schumannella luteola]
MTALLIAIAAIALWGMLGTIELVARDGYGRIPTRYYYPIV